MTYRQPIKRPMTPDLLLGLSDLYWGGVLNEGGLCCPFYHSLTQVNRSNTLGLFLVKCTSPDHLNPRLAGPTRTCPTDSSGNRIYKEPFLSDNLD